jgi:hypothetical protein
MRALLLFALLSAITSTAAAKSDRELERLLVGRWEGTRHDYEYRRDGEWLSDPDEPEFTSRGKWRLSGGKLIETWRFLGFGYDSYCVWEILALDQTRLKIRYAEGDSGGPASVGTICELKRIPREHHSR